MKIHFDEPHTCEKYNSNNGWGFGGSVGYEYKFGDRVRLVIGSACYRHLPSQKHTTVWYKDSEYGCFIRVLDLAGSGKVQIDKAKNMIKAILDGTLIEVIDDDGRLSLVRH